MQTGVERQSATPQKVSFTPALLAAPVLSL